MYYIMASPKYITSYKPEEELMGGKITENPLEFETKAEAYEIHDRIIEEWGDDYGLSVVGYGDDEETATDTDAIQPTHYNKGDIDLYEAAYLTRPFNEVRAILEFTAERYIKRDKNNRVEDISKAIYTLERLREYEVKEREND